MQTSGAAGELGGPGLLLSVATTLHRISPAQAFLSCLYMGQSARSAMHAPGCPDANSRLGFAMVNADAGRVLVHHVAGSLHAGRGPLPVAQGYSLTSAGVDERVRFAALWLTF